jgi:hypothetical protein
MTVRIAHSTHRWTHQLECKLCGCAAASKLGAAPCPQAPFVPQPKPKGLPDFREAALRGAKDILPPE